MYRNVTAVAPDRQGIVVRSAVRAGGVLPQHAEGIVVATTLRAGDSPVPQHAEGLVAPG